MGGINNCFRKVKQNPDLYSNKGLAEYFSVSKKRMLMIAALPGNQFPPPKEHLLGRMNFYSLSEVLEWLGNRDIMAIKYTVEPEECDKNDKKKIQEVGVGGRAVGKHLRDSAWLIRSMYQPLAKKNNKNIGLKR